MKRFRVGRNQIKWPNHRAPWPVRLKKTHCSKELLPLPVDLGKRCGMHPKAMTFQIAHQSTTSLFRWMCTKTPASCGSRTNIAAPGSSSKAACSNATSRIPGVSGGLPMLFPTPPSRKASRLSCRLHENPQIPNKHPAMPRQPSARTSQSPPPFIQSLRCLIVLTRSEPWHFSLFWTLTNRLSVLLLCVSYNMSEQTVYVLW